jgi:hypothetical protein
MSLGPNMFLNQSGEFYNRSGVTTPTGLSNFLEGAGQDNFSNILSDELGGWEGQAEALQRRDLMSPDEAARINALYQLQDGQYGDENLKYLNTSEVEASDLFGVSESKVLPAVQATAKKAVEQFDRESKEVATDILNTPLPFNKPRGRPETLEGFLDHVMHFSNPEITGIANHTKHFNRMKSMNDTVNSELPKLNALMNKYGLGAVASNAEELARLFGYDGAPLDDIIRSEDVSQADNHNFARAIRTALDTLSGGMSGGIQVSPTPDLYIPPPPVDDPYAGLDPRMRSRIFVTENI